jgi:hypothetical protein
VEGGFDACTVALAPAKDGGRQRTVRFKNRQCPVFQSAAGEVVVVDDRNARAAGLNLDRQLFALPNGLLVAARSAGDVVAVSMALNIVIPGFTRLGESEPAAS